MTEYKRQDITTELRGALQEVKDHIEGKKRLQSLDSLLDEYNIASQGRCRDSKAQRSERDYQRYGVLSIK